MTKMKMTRLGEASRFRWESNSTYWPTVGRDELLHTYYKCVFGGYNYSDEHEFLTMCVALGVTEEEVVAYRARQRLGVGNG